MPSETLISPVIAGFCETGRVDALCFSSEKTFFPGQYRPDDDSFDAIEDVRLFASADQSEGIDFDDYPGICACGYSYRAYGLKFCSLDCHLEYEGSSTVLPTKNCAEQPTVFKVATLKQIAFKALTAKLNREYSTARYPEFRTVASYAASRLTQIYATSDDPDYDPALEYAEIKADCETIADIGQKLAENAKRDLDEIAVVRSDVMCRRNDLLQAFCSDLVEISDLDAALLDEDRGHLGECVAGESTLYPLTSKIIGIIIDAIKVYDATKALSYFQDYIVDEDYLHNENFYYREVEYQTRVNALLGFCASVAAYVVDTTVLIDKTESLGDTVGVSSLIENLSATSFEPAPELCGILLAMLAYELICFYINISVIYTPTSPSRQIEKACDLLSFADATFDCEWGFVPGPNLYTDWDHQFRNAGTRIRLPLDVPYDNRTLARKLAAMGYTSRYRDSRRRAYLT